MTPEQCAGTYADSGVAAFSNRDAFNYLWKIEIAVYDTTSPHCKPIASKVKATKEAAARVHSNNHKGRTPVYTYWGDHMKPVNGRPLEGIYFQINPLDTLVDSAHVIIIEDNLSVRDKLSTLEHEIAHYADTSWTEAQADSVELCVIAQNDKPRPEDPIDNDFCPGELAECSSDDGGPRIIIEHWVCEFWVRTKCIRAPRFIGHPGRNSVGFFPSSGG